MKRIFRVKWELVMVLLNVVASAVAFFTYFYTKEVNVLVIAIASLVCFAVVVFNYKTISYMRKLTLKMW